MSCPCRYHNSPTWRAASKGVCPGKTPKYPSAPGISTSSTCSLTSMRSADTIWSWRWEGKDMTLVNLRLLPSLSRLAFTEPFDHVFDRPRHPEILLRDLVVLAIHDFLEAANRVGNHDVLAIKTSELLGNEEGLREELLNLPRARHRELVLLGKLVDPEDGDDVLQIFVALQNLFDGACHAIVQIGRAS